MYSVIITIHAVFFLIAHLLGYRFFEWLFIIFGIFFLFYFSPLFFMEDEKNTEKKSFQWKWILEKFSPKESLLIPLSLLYVAVYGFVISAFGTSESFLSIHSILSIGIFLIFFGYMMSFEWKNDLFSEIFRFHIFISFLSGIWFGVLAFFDSPYHSILFLILSIITVISGTYFLSFSRNVNTFFLPLFLGNSIAALFLICKYIFDFPSSNLLLVLSVLSSIFYFEYLPKISFFRFHTEIIRYFSLFLLLITLPFLLYSSFFSLFLPFILLTITTLFFLSIHIRYSNYIAYSIWLFLIYFLYSLFFISLLLSGGLLPVLLFIFFLPFLLIGITYFWEERFEYDFPILHYSAIGFSGVYFLYSIFFIGWWGNLLFMISSGIFCLAILFFMSFFRFRK